MTDFPRCEWQLRHCAKNTSKEGVENSESSREESLLIWQPRWEELFMKARECALRMERRKRLKARWSLSQPYKPSKVLIAARITVLSSPSRFTALRNLTIPGESTQGLQKINPRIWSTERLAQGSTSQNDLGNASKQNITLALEPCQNISNPDGRVICLGFGGASGCW